MGDFLITRRGGKSADRTESPSINFISATTTSLVFTFKNNENEQVDLYYGINQATPTTKITLASNATSSNITFSGLTNTTLYNITAFAVVTNPISKKIKSVIVETEGRTLVPAPTITQVSKTAFAITFTVRNNSSKNGEVIYGLTTPPVTTTIPLNSNTTSTNQTIEDLQPLTTYTVFAQTIVPGFTNSTITSSNVTTETDWEPIEATGGSISTIGNYRYHAFTSVGSSTFSVSNAGTDNQVDVVIVAGGGAGGGRHGGGGGAGGVLFGTFNSINTQNYTVTVGGGGSPAQVTTNVQGVGNNGANSSAFGATTNGGGGGGSTSSPGAGRNGGSGGGGGGTGDVNGLAAGSANQTSVGSLTGYGNNGGTGHLSGTGMKLSGGGGGGAGAAGQAAPNDNDGGNGGNGINLSSSFPNWGTNSSNTTSGTRGWFGGGGGGGSQPVRSDRPGGVGGGGNGRGNDNGNAFSGQVNTGGGGGGHRSMNTSLTGGAGGSGIVVIRYPLTKPN